MSNPRISPEIVRFCAIECQLQMSGEVSVYLMVQAWSWAMGNFLSQPAPDKEDILTLGQLIEPDKNAYGFRQCMVTVGGDTPPHYEEVPRLIDRLLAFGDGITPVQFFHEFETIHPFVDGNGRTGVILYNWLNESLHDPKWAPNLFGDPRRVEGYGANATRPSEL